MFVFISSVELSRVESKLQFPLKIEEEGDEVCSTFARYLFDYFCVVFFFLN